jgi:hypothetical protein
MEVEVEGEKKRSGAGDVRRRKENKPNSFWCDFFLPAG